MYQKADTNVQYSDKDTSIVLHIVYCSRGNVTLLDRSSGFLRDILSYAVSKFFMKRVLFMFHSPTKIENNKSMTYEYNAD